jgi:hypothetical protein
MNVKNVKYEWFHGSAALIFNYDAGKTSRRTVKS